MFSRMNRVIGYVKKQMQDSGLSVGEALDKVENERVQSKKALSTFSDSLPKPS